MKFKFRLDFLIKHNKDKEKQAIIEYSKAVSAVSDVNDEIKASMDRVNQCRQHICDVEAKGGNIGATVIMEVDFINRLGLKIKDAEIRLVAANEFLEEQRLLLVEAQRETKKVELLRERKFEEFKKAKKLREQKSIDDMITSRFKRGQI